MPDRERIQRGEVGRGFTLIELLVVVAIIALLVAIITPSLKRGAEMARRSACLSNQRQIMIGAGSFASRTGGSITC